MKKSLVLIMLLFSALWLANATPTIADEVEYVYDDLNRVQDVIYDGQSTITYTHDDVGNRETEVTDSDGDGVPDNQKTGLPGPPP